ncbi:restriction system protein [Streptosporangium subroseum]|uniref:Restriction system protein n=1 Tax=Streptosporangium subroseum TaxID=106412 RepID=A0A239N3P5_9ACTN|nr:CBS domain-containing protein [Streptosporangium subroseum]SNT48798.1 restriction system protein [Streptosporangium subroseum]
MTSRAWLVRLGEIGQRENIALDKGLVILGWSKLGDLSTCESRTEIAAMVKENYPGEGKATLSNWTGQLWRFLREIREGDLIVCPLKTRPTVAVGRVTGPYRYQSDADPGFRQVRPVEWLRTDISKSAIEQDLRNSMSSLLTVCALSRFGAPRRIAHLAEKGIDPGPTPDEMAMLEGFATPHELLDGVIANSTGDPIRLTIREFLKRWGVTRRTSESVARIEADLVAKGVTTRPSFTEGWFDNVIELLPVGEEPDSTAQAPSQSLQPDVEDAPDLPAITLRVGVLESANKGVASVRLEDKLSIAHTKMLSGKYSQLAVLDENGTLRGAVSWESIGKASMRKQELLTVSDAVDRTVGSVDHHEDLLSQVTEIYDKGYVFVCDSDKKVIGIITAADLTQQFGHLARPFVLVEEAERRLRRRANEVFTLDELRQAAPRHLAAKVSSANDLMLGAYKHLLASSAHWDRLEWPLDHELFLGLLELIREVRNELMHFAPDPLDGETLTRVEGFIEMLRIVDPRP